MPFWEMAFKLFLSGILGGLVGAERETHDRPAGLRTHTLVCMGSALFTLVSYGLAGDRFDPGRVTAQIVTGIGFLGAGTIIRQGSEIRGLTTAASIWAVAAIGVATAVGGVFTYLAISGTVLVVGTLTLLRNVERLMLVHEDRTVTVTVPGDREAVDRAVGLLSRHSIRLKIQSGQSVPETNQRILRVRMHTERGFDENAVSAELTMSNDVISYKWE